LLLFVFLTMWSVKMGHAFFMHHRHADRPVCEAAADRYSAHLHDERYTGEDCTLCAFVLAVPEIFSISVLPDVVLVAPATTRPSLYRSLYGQSGYDTTVCRGPPAAA
jgi:hypothetical protein